MGWVMDSRCFGMLIVWMLPWIWAESLWVFIGLYCHVYYLINSVSVEVCAKQSFVCKIVLK